MKEQGLNILKYPFGYVTIRTFAEQFYIHSPSVKLAVQVAAKGHNS